MKSSKHISHRIHHTYISYPTSLKQRLYSIFVGPLLSVFVLVAVLNFFAAPILTHQSIPLSTLATALFSTVGRLFIAYILAVVVAVPLALVATSGTVAESFFLSVFDILESVPVLAFFPVLIVIFLKFHFLNGAAIFVLFLSMLWNIVFTLVGGLKIIPQDIKDAAKIFGVHGFTYFRKVLLPAIFPELVTGSILAVAQGWNITIIAEVLHVYIPSGTSSDDLFGLGSILVNAASHGQTILFIAALIVMVLAIAFLNFFLWQKLLRLAERFKFE